jgi:hypothetical protein
MVAICLARLLQLAAFLTEIEESQQLGPDLFLHLQPRRPGK